MSIEAIQALYPQSADPAGPRRSIGSRGATDAKGRTAPSQPNAVSEPRQFEVNASFTQNNVIIYRILDKQTGTLVLQIPPEQLLRIAQSVSDMLRGDPSPGKLNVES